MSTLLFANNAGSTLAGAITNTSTSLNLAAGGGALFPNPSAGQYFVITAIDAATGLLREIMSCTARSSDTLTVTRAQESTTALSWNPGDLIQNLWTAGQAAQMLQQGQAPSSIIYYGADTGTVNALISTVNPAAGALTNGAIYSISPAFANTSTAVTLNVSALGAFNVKRSDGTALQLGDIQAPPYQGLFAWNAANTEFLLLNPALWSTQRIKLTGATSYYVATTGSDSTGNGTSGTPWATLQHAINYIIANVDTGGFNITINLANGTYTTAGQVSVSNALVGGGFLIINGNTGSPTAVELVNSTSTGATLLVQYGVYVQVQGLYFINNDASSGELEAQSGGTIQINGICAFGTTPGYHMAAGAGGIIYLNSGYSIVGNAFAHYVASEGGRIFKSTTAALTINLTGTPTFTQFAYATNQGGITAALLSFSGSAVGARYLVNNNSVINTSGGGATYFPGSAGGGSAAGGLYL